jgi:hypothetical protein
MYMKNNTSTAAALLPIPVLLEMEMGKNPLGITCPNPYSRKKNTPAKKLIPMGHDGYKILPKPISMRVLGIQRVSHTH